MKRSSIFYTLFFIGLFTITTCTKHKTEVLRDPGGAGPLGGPKPGDDNKELAFLTQTNQLVTDGLRSGEGYFSKDGQYLVYQAEKSPENPFYQIFLRDLNSNKDYMVSNGIGKTTCAWIHPENKSVLYASSHLDEKAIEKQEEELARRQSGETRRYAWDYDPEYEIFSRDYFSVISGQAFSATNLTEAYGYDAEGSYSPDGKKILFVSNRNAYAHPEDFPEEVMDQFAENPSILIDLYIMNADGSGVKQLTDALGYDGGPFFNKQGNKIIWRRFDMSGRIGEVMVMDINLETLETSEPRQLTDLKATSWAPYFHPSGLYTIFTSTASAGHRNFELMIARVDGKGEPVRVTYTEGADVLPVFSPDGNSLVWSSQRNEKGQAQLYRAQWNHEKALEALKLK